jgi:hypothetical protein
MGTVALASLVCCATIGNTGCTNNLKNDDFKFGPSGAQVTAAAIGVGAVVVGTVVLIHVHHSHHTLKGCVSNGTNGLEAQTQDNMKTYSLTGETANIKVGDLVRFHGSRGKKVKGSAGNQTFAVEKISKDYGPCSVNSAPPANSR